MNGVNPTQFSKQGFLGPKSGSVNFPIPAYFFFLLAQQEGVLQGPL